MRFLTTISAWNVGCLSLTPDPVPILLEPQVRYIANFAPLPAAAAASDCTRLLGRLVSILSPLLHFYHSSERLPIPIGLTTHQRYIRTATLPTPAPSDQDVAPQMATINALSLHLHNR
jgi:hypothetical protein